LLPPSHSSTDRKPKDCCINPYGFSKPHQLDTADVISVIVVEFNDGVSTCEYDGILRQKFSVKSCLSTPLRRHVL